MKIHIEHLGYSIKVKDTKGGKHEGKYVAWVIKEDVNNCTIYIKRPIPRFETATLAHEVLHILQYIAEARNIDMIYEQEHMGYLMQFIMNKILGYKYLL